MASFEQGTAEQVKNGQAQFRAGAIVGKQAATFVGAKIERVEEQIPGSQGSTRFVDKKVGGTKIYHRTVTYLSQNSDGTISGAERVVYIEKNGTWQPAAISKDGGKTYQFSDPNYPTMDGVAGTGLANELNDLDGDIHKNLDKQVNDSLDRAGFDEILTDNKKNVIDSIKNNTDQNDAEESSDDGDGEDKGLTDADQLEAAKKEFDISSIDIGERGGTRSAAGSFGNHIYPLDLGLSGQDVLKFTMLKYVPSDINMSGGFLGVDTGVRNEDFETLGNREILGTVVLPIPGGISDNNTVSWGSQNMNPAEVAAAQFALNTIMGGVDGATLAAKNLVDAITGNTGDIKTATGAVIAGAAAGVGQQLITRTTGAVINPSMELLFNGPALRQFQFKFTFTARESEESKEVARIIRFFKQGSAVQRTASNLFLKSPHTFKLQYLFRGPSGGDNPFMGKIKECACTGVSVNYTPQNNYATFSDGAMTSYELSLNFSELEPVYNDEYGSEGELPAAIGF